MKIRVPAGLVILAAGVVGIIGGCTEPNSGTTVVASRAATFPQRKQPAMKTIQIESQPPGARIEVNDDYVGDAPCNVQVRADGEGRFWEETKIRALPKGYGYTQSKLFFGLSDYPYVHSDRVPQKVFFDTNLGPVPSDINVNVNP